MAEFVSVQSSGGLATIRLDRPPVNALSIALQGELKDAAEQVNADPDLRAAVIYGGGEERAGGEAANKQAGRGYSPTAPRSRRVRRTRPARGRAPDPAGAAGPAVVR